MLHELLPSTDTSRCVPRGDNLECLSGEEKLKTIKGNGAVYNDLNIERASHHAINCQVVW